MARRRTRREKIAAQNRYVVPQLSKNKTEDQVKKEIPEQTNKVSFYSPEISLPINLVVSDLTKTGVVTILALIFQFALSAYLNKGGWQTINGMLHKIISVY